MGTGPVMMAIAQDGEEPRARIAAALIDRLERALERILHDIFGRTIITAEIPGIAPRAVEMGQDQRRKPR
ncbi:hypothetical protein NSE01_00100 [Novosphingobium sediminis]|uniref:Uncharacterized protein n=1 Tax=Novosphingobium sediminis TaxID=707214 RepID=A0A512AEQ0_9SPHN|nr:hypothetical protein NSE01_00100 [Novosphingobium sediminis]